MPRRYKRELYARATVFSGPNGVVLVQETRVLAASLATEGVQYVVVAPGDDCSMVGADPTTALVRKCATTSRAGKQRSNVDHDGTVPRSTSHVERSCSFGSNEMCVAKPRRAFASRDSTRSSLSWGPKSPSALVRRTPGWSAPTFDMCHSILRGGVSNQLVESPVRGIDHSASLQNGLLIAPTSCLVAAIWKA